MEWWERELRTSSSNTPTLQYSNTPILQYSNTPTLQHSNTPTLQYSTLLHQPRIIGGTMMVGLPPFLSSLCSMAVTVLSSNSTLVRLFSSLVMEANCR